MNAEVIKSSEIINNGGTILYPTDTIWGIGCDATNNKAVNNIYQIKNREDSKSMLVLIDSIDRLKHYVDNIPEKTFELIKNSKKPLTIIFPNAKNIAKNLIASDGSIGIRVTKDEFCIKLISTIKSPIVSTSANISGVPHPTNYKEIDNKIKKEVDYIVNLRQNEDGASPSSIIKLTTNGDFFVIRK